MTAKLPPNDPRIVWTAELDGKYLVQVQRTGPHTARLVMYLGDVCLLDEETGLSYGARFGPDESDVEDWCRRVQDVVDRPKQ